MYAGMHLMSESLLWSTGRHCRSVGCDHVLTCPVKGQETMDPVLIQNFFRAPVKPPLTKVRQKGKHIQSIPVQNRLSGLNLWIQVKNRRMYLIKGKECKKHIFIFLCIWQIILFILHTTNFLM